MLIVCGAPTTTLLPAISTISSTRTRNRFFLRNYVVDTLSSCLCSPRGS